MRVLVTGGSGFVGSHIVDGLCEAGLDVRVLDVRAPVPDATETAGRGGVEYLQGDVRDPALVRRAVAGVDAVCHQAAKVGLGVDFGDITSYVADNDEGTAVLLDAMWRHASLGRLVLASSMVVYGDGLVRCPEHGAVVPGPRRPTDLAAGRFDPPCSAPRCDARVVWEPVTEDCAVRPRNIYAATKLHQEHLCEVFGRETGATVVALRYHNVYGPRMPRDTPYAGVASIFASELAAGRAPQIFEDGGQTRDFVHVRDVARANVIALTAGVVESGAYNVASGSARTIRDLAGALCATCGSGAPAPEVAGRWRLGDVRHIVASASKAADVLGFRAEVGFTEGMAEFARGERGERGERGVRAGGPRE